MLAMLRRTCEPTRLTSVLHQEHPNLSADMAAFLVQSTRTMSLAFEKCFLTPSSDRPSAPVDMARHLAKSTTTIGIGLPKSLAELRPVLLCGGGPHKKNVSVAELGLAEPAPGEELSIAHCEYVLQGYLPLKEIPCLALRAEGSVVCKIPMRTVCSKLSAPELRDLARVHGLGATKRHVRAALETMLAQHTCSDECPDLYAYLAPLVSAVAPTYNGLMDVSNEDFAKSIRLLPVETVRPFLPSGSECEGATGFAVTSVCRTRPIQVQEGNVVAANIPLSVLANSMTILGLRSLGTVHGMHLPARWARTETLNAVGTHTCSSCPTLYYVLAPVLPKTRSRVSHAEDWLDSDPSPLLWQAFVELPSGEYPPRPTTMHDIATAMRSYCKELSPDRIVQAGCTVCGTLHTRADMVDFDEGAYDLMLLEELGATRQTRVSTADPIQDLKGPVLTKGLTKVCGECHESLKSNRRPKMALANHLWLGDVPDCLKDLTLGECAMISRIRYNQCVVRVSQGHAKMVANVIAFEHPSKKIYDRLPMSKDELSEVLAVLYTGVEPPSDDDLRRTPVLVRRDKVRAALEWLKLNHIDYADLTIDYTALDTYELESVPIGVLKKQAILQDGNVLAAAKSVFDNTYEEGTSDGMCPFTVSGLTAERHSQMTTSQRKVAALLYLKNGGSSLAVGHEQNPQSIWNNPKLYPQMFPWLFPYGHGGVGQEVHNNVIGRDVHIHHLLGYHDKRFQRDAGFLIVQMNHQLIRQSSRGSFVSMKRGNFGRAAEAIDKLDPAVLLTIGERLKNGGRFVPRNPEEKRCATLMDQVDVFGTWVDGSLAKKKQQRGEIWSLINFRNAPTWFFTISPADAKHPLCIHWASNDVEFRPEIKGYKERQHLVTRNPVACAQFFDHIVRIFIKHLCGWSDDEKKRGLFGIPDAYYGTVEEQGRKTLHLHFLLWIRGQLPLHVVRERLMSDDSEFLREVTEYIESCVVGEFLTGSKDEVAARVPLLADDEDRGIHTILSDKTAVAPGYEDPTLTMPEAPPDVFCDTPGECACEDCLNLLSWWERFKLRFDDILVRSNVHACFASKAKKTDETATATKQDGSKVSRVHTTGKGCLDKNGVCKARFPREVFMNTTLDLKTGHLNIQKREATINDVTPGLTYAHGCNTDSRCLLSGTSVKAVVGYVTDYISKAWLKTHQIFEAAYDAFTKHEDILKTPSDDQGKNNARRMVLKVINSLSSKMEIGGPMAALYLLKNPDHYTSHEFVPFYWKNYLNYVEGEWTALEQFVDPDSQGYSTLPERVGVDITTSAAVSSVAEVRSEVLDELGIDLNDDNASLVNVKLEDHNDGVMIFDAGVNDENVRDGGVDTLQPGSASQDMHLRPEMGIGELHSGGDKDERVCITRSRGRYYAKSSTDDYRFRPIQLEHISLYEFVQCSVRHPINSERKPRSDLRWFRFTDDHPQVASTAVAMDPSRAERIVPNFIGPSLPRREGGNKEEYCAAMLTLFMPWRTGIDMKSADETWEQVFDSFPFSARQRELLANFNMRYECYDARDDYGALSKVAVSGLVGADDGDNFSDCDSVYAENGENDEDDDDLVRGLGKATAELHCANAAMVLALRKAGWKADSARSNGISDLPRVVLDRELRSNAWNNIIKVEKLRAWRRKQAPLGKNVEDDDTVAVRNSGGVPNDVKVVKSTYISRDFAPPEGGWGSIMSSIIHNNGLNYGQEKAFRIVANHACLTAPGQLLMHLGGMGGTGKSTVIKALSAFFVARSEGFRFALLGPTGTSAALIGGQTYHSFLGINSSWTKGNSGTRLEEVRERLLGVGYILIDEHSMLDCRALCTISARCCEAVGLYEKPFGGLNVILCGDFAQLPPVKGLSLYSRRVQMQQTARQTVAEQENTIGKHIWLQFTTVVMLTENMRQTASEPDEEAFRAALENLRWHACTPADIAVIRSRLAGKDPSLSVDAPGFKNVSIITALNRDKDQINATGSARFAAETGQELVDFYSTDVLKSAEPQRRNPKKSHRKYDEAHKMNKGLQRDLWSQPPCTSEQIPGKLSLCLGLPLLIRYNEATELCITRGQEARVVGWTAHHFPKSPGKKYLDTLYVQLQGPPQDVKMPHLPKNVVPLTRNTEAVEAQLPSDRWVCISRSQMPVLPNFAMTDYSAQGKTRAWNVVDLTRCKSFQGVYTCLSRGTSLARTLIVRDFPDSLLKGTLDGGLRQEYRELDDLNIITDALYQGLLPEGILRETRWETIAAYRVWKSTVGARIAAAPTLPEGATAPQRINYAHQTLDAYARRKRLATTIANAPVTKKKMTWHPTLANRAWASPTGPRWDSADWSCAFDSLTFIVHSLWVSDRVKWSRVLRSCGFVFGSMVDGFEGMQQVDPEAEITEVRDQWRTTLRGQRPNEFPVGRVGVDIMSLCRRLLDYEFQGNNVTLRCGSCSDEHAGGLPFPATLGPFASVRGSDSVQGYVDRCFGTLGDCATCGGPLYALHSATDIAILEVVEAGDLVVNDRVQFGLWGLYRLVGIVYFGDGHFISRAVSGDNKVYWHDGMDGGHSTYEGVLGESFAGDLRTCAGKSASLAVYALADRRRGSPVGAQAMDVD